MRFTPALLLCLTACASAAKTEAQPSTSKATALPNPERILFWTPEEQKVGYQSVERLGPTRTVAAAETASELPAGDPLPSIQYTVDGKTFDTDGFVAHNHVVGLLVIKDGRVVLERYEGGNDANTRWISFSVTKSIVSLLIGAAVKDGKIGSVNDPVTKYLPNLAGSAYDGVTVENVLQMASGVEWNEDYADPESDIGKTARFTAPEHLAYLASKPRAAEPGTKFNYNTGETHLVGAMLRSAIGGDLAPYLSEKIWKPFGMQRDAVWPLLEKDGAEHGGCCLAATLRDYGRVGMFTLASGDALPADWMKQSTTPSKGYPGYGYLWWLKDGTYAAAGIFGQSIWVSPQDGLVIASHSMWPKAVGKEFTGHRAAFFGAVAAALRK
ncbi:MAG: serine hydrolase domain-containing protein [Deltaproteobacteria bacterium]|jgi:CubicO group peptidase (beta-lactamase class C family)